MQLRTRGFAIVLLHFSVFFSFFLFLFLKEVGGSFTAILNFGSLNFIAEGPYVTTNRGKAYMGFKEVLQVA